MNRCTQGKPTREFLFGDFNWGVLCTPRWPWSRTKKQTSPPFYGPFDFLGVVTAAIMGLQHALAMAGGLVTPPLLVGMMAPDAATKSYLIQASLLICGFMTFVQVLGIPIYRTNLRWGAGLLSVMGVSFASLPLVTTVTKSQLAAGVSFDESFGQMLGTIAVCAVWPMLLSFLPYKALKKVFPPIVTGVTIFLIGINLVQTGFQYWGGGVFCGENYEHLPATVPCLLPQKDGSTINAMCYNADIRPVCTDNGYVKLPYGSGPYIGMGLLVFSTIILLELFGSPFMRNASLVLSLIVGLIFSAIFTVDGNSFLTGEKIAAAPAFTFLWVKRFPLGFYPPAILPLLIVFTITSVETVGDVTATAETSRLPVGGEEHVKRIKGGMLNDGISGIFSALGGSLPLTTFAQNNGVIALTNVSSRQAGYGAAGWLLLWGILGKFGGLILTIPHCVLGGATSFLFASVITSGIKILMMGEGFTRRNRFIVACALAMGLGVTMVPQWAENNLWPEPPAGSSSSLSSVRLAVLLILETGFCVGAVVAFILNLIMPYESPAVENARSIDLDLSRHVPNTLAMSPDTSVDAKMAITTPPAAPIIDKHADGAV